MTSIEEMEKEECNHCGSLTRVLMTDETPLGTFRWCIRCTTSVCRICKENSQQVHKHHCSYLFDITVRLCEECHMKVHHEDGFYDDLAPTITRSKAQALGVDHTFQN
jgi:hypothetical protein